MNNDLEIVPCSPDHIETLITVAQKSYRQYYTYLWTDQAEAYMQRSFSSTTIRQEIADPNAAFFLAVYQGVPSGFLKLNLNKAMPGFPAIPALEVERVYLLQEVSGKGIGRRLIDFAIQQARNTDKNAVWLKTMDSSTAAGFYERMGFIRFGTERLSYPEMKEEYRGMIWMKLELGK
jgi:GNAT superfamily N-acetyltransferase